MEVSVKMTPEEFDEFRAYQTDKASFKAKIEDEVYEPFDRIRVRHEGLCTLILTAVEEEAAPQDTYGRGQTPEIFTAFNIKDKDALASAIDLAADWFA